MDMLILLLISGFLAACQAAHVIDFETSPWGKKWPSHKIDYLIDGTIFANESVAIRNAIATLEKYTCLEFTENENATENYIAYARFGTDRCMGNVGKQRSYNLVIGNWRCFSKIGYILHETMHNLGFLHEHQRPDRNSHVTINWDNIRPKKFRQFRIIDEHEQMLGTQYDTVSVMHYEPWLFAKSPDLLTMTTENSYKQQYMGQKSGLSPGDVAAINDVYCKGKTARLPYTSRLRQP